MNYVYLLSHIHKLNDGEESEKLIGIYRTKKDALNAKSRASVLPGFSESKGGFHIDKYEINVDHWQEGYVTVYHDK